MRDSQGESEHKVSKSRYHRTSGKDVARALSKVERRQRTIQTIRNTLSPSLLISSCRRMRVRKETKLDPIFSPKMQYNIGENENSPVDIPLFLSRNHGDPAVKVRTPFSSLTGLLMAIFPCQDFLPKLHSHILPRIVNMLKREQISRPEIVYPV